MAKAKDAPKWRRVFLRVLGASGNVRMAARAAGVDHSSAYQLRKRDGGFARSWEAAVARAGARAAAGELQAPARGFAGSAVRPASGDADAGDGAAGLVVRRSRNAGVQVVRAGPGRWSVAAERGFLEALARTACVRRAAEAVGLSTAAVYARRKGDAGLAARWAAALAAGEERIGDFLTATVLAAFDPEVAASGIPAASVAEAIAISKLKEVRRGQAAAAAREGQDFEAVKASILRKIEAIERAEGGGAYPAVMPLLDSPHPNPSAESRASAEPEGEGLITGGAIDG